MRGLAVGSSLSITGAQASIGAPIGSCISFVSCVATLITNEYFSELKMRLTKLKDWINMITLLYEKTLDKATIDKKLIKKK